MEKIKELVDVRFEIIKQYKKEIIQLQNENYNLADNSNIQRKILKFMINAKKEEKQRVNTENKLFEIFFGERSNSKQSILLFYQVSLQIMNSIHEEFELEQEMIFCKEPEYIDVAALYVEFFQQTNYSQRADEIKMIIKNDLYERVPFFCLLLKWLVEMTRNQFGEFIKENSDIYLKQLTSNRNKGSQKEIMTITSNQEMESQRYVTSKQITNNSVLFISETLQTDNRRSRRSKRSSMNSLDHKQLELLIGNSQNNNNQNNNKYNDKNQNAFRNTMQNFQRANSQKELQLQQAQSGQSQQNNNLIQFNNSNNNNTTIANASQICSSTKNSNLSQTQQNFSTISQNPIEKKRLSPLKRQQNMINILNDVLDLEINNFSMEMINFLMKKLGQPDGSLTEQGKQQIVNFMISKNSEVKSTIDYYYVRFQEKYPQLIKQQQQNQQQAKQQDKVLKRRKIQVVNCYGQSSIHNDQNGNQNGLSEFRRNSQIGRSDINSARPFSSQGAYSNSVNQSLNQSQIKIDKKQALTNSFEIVNNLQDGIATSQQQINTDQQYRPSSRLRNENINRIVIETKVKHLSLDQNYSSQNNASQNGNTNQIKNQNSRIPYNGSLFSSDNISQERQVQNLTKLSQDQFVQRMRSTHKIYYLSRKNNNTNNINNQTGSTNHSTQGSQNSQGFQDNHVVQQQQQKNITQVQKQVQNYVTPVKVTPAEPTEAAYSTIMLATQGNDSQKNLLPTTCNLDKVDTIDYSSVVFTTQSSNRNQPQHPLVIPNPQYQYFYSTNSKQPQSNGLSAYQSLDSANRPKTASVTETNNRSYGLKGKINVQYLQNSKRQRSRSINQQLSQGKKSLPNNWVSTQQSNQSTILPTNQNLNGDVIKRIAEVNYQASLNNSVNFYGGKDPRLAFSSNPSNQNPQIGSTTLPIQSQMHQNTNQQQQFRVSSAKKQSSIYQVENNTNIKEKFYSLTKEKRRMSQTSQQVNQQIIGPQQKIDNALQLFTQSTCFQPNPQKQSALTKNSMQNQMNNQNGVTNVGTRARFSLSVSDSQNANQNQSNVRSSSQQVNQQTNYNTNYKSNPSNIVNQDISVNLIQQSVIQYKQIQQQYANQQQIKVNHIRVNSKKRQ